MDNTPTTALRDVIEALEPCPFCGKAAEFDPPAVYSGVPVFTIRCCIADTRRCYSREDAIAKWNKRSDTLRRALAVMEAVEAAPHIYVREECCGGPVGWIDQSVPADFIGKKCRLVLDGEA